MTWVNERKTLTSVSEYGIKDPPSRLKLWMGRPSTWWSRRKAKKQRAKDWARAVARGAILDTEINEFRSEYLKAERENKVTEEMRGAWFMYLRFLRVWYEVKEI